MSRFQRESKTSFKKSKRKQEPNPYTARIIKNPSKQELETTLRHAVRNQDMDAFEEYDEWEF
jgi:hypothetical protein